ncbi:MAG: HYR domain-containing protein [Saprospiraceae bacterium]|nr:HYR domain-containing protein [Saprospiraceae bacterium]
MNSNSRSRSLLTLIGIICLNGLLFAQKDTEFWFVAPEISQNNASNFDRPVAFRFSTYGTPAIVTVSQPANPAFPVQTINIAANTSGVLQLPPFFQFVENTPANTVHNKGFLIQSTAPITAYYELIGGVPNNPELFSMKGKNALGTTFYTPFQNITDNSADYTPFPKSAFDIVASENNTTVTITPTRAIVGHPANVSFNITLNRGQTWSGEASSHLGNQHPTGTKIVSDKPIAVTIKDDLLESGWLFGGFCRDVMADQMVPVDKLGTRYVVQKGLLNGDEFAFVLATENGTQVKMDGVVVAPNLNAGQMANLSVTAGPHMIETSSPAYVWQMTGHNCEVAGEIMPALDCSGSNAVRFVRSTAEPFHLFLTTRNGFQDGFVLNGNPNLILPGSFQVVPGSGGEFVAAAISFENNVITAGQSSVVSNSQGLFQMGFLNGGVTTGCRYGFFSDFGNKVLVENTIALCAGDTTLIEGQSYTAPASLNFIHPGINGACDTSFVYELILKNQVVTNTFIPLCPDQSILIGGFSYFAPNVVNVLNPGQNGACDTLATYELTLKPQVSFTQNIALCPGETTLIGGQQYAAPAIVNLTHAGQGDACDTLATYELTLKPQVSFTQNIALCPGETTLIGGQQYAAPATVNLTLAGLNGTCDTLATYELSLKSQVSITENIPLCPGETVSLGGQTYTAPTSVNLTLAGQGDACDTLATYILRLLPQETFTQPVSLCPGETIVLGGQTYTAPATVNLTLQGQGDECDTLGTYVLSLLQQPTVSRTIQFCPGETVTLGGVNYTQPTTVILNLPATTGCDTIATYTLVSLTPAPSNVGIFCPNNVSLVTIPGTGPTVVNYPMPVAATDCPCPGVALNLSAGLPSGSVFPVTSTPVCWVATDSCGQSSSCCFVVTVREEEPCDVKLSGCLKYELLTITADAEKNRTYRVRVTNNCSNRLIYTAIQVPDGMTAIYPTDNSTYEAPNSGREYLVRSPNYSPMYSVRFKSTTDSIANGESEIFRYKLPAQADVTFIDIVSRLEPQIFLEAHLNTFYCPIGVTPAGERPGEDRLDKVHPLPANLLVFPNPTQGVLYLDLADWDGQWLNIRLVNSNGQTVLTKYALANGELLQWNLPEQLAPGLYFLEVQGPDGKKVVEKVGVIRH